MEWNFKSLSAALGCFDKPLNQKGLAKANYELCLVVEDNRGEDFSLYDLYSDSLDPEFAESYDNIAHVYGRVGEIEIEFKKNGSIILRRPKQGMKMLLLDFNTYKKRREDVIEIKKDVRIPGTNILLEKGDKIIIK